MRWFIFRTPEWDGKIYSVFSEDRSVTWDVSFDGQSRCVTFWMPGPTLIAKISQLSLSFRFVTGDDVDKGGVREARFSVFGRSIVEDENHQVIGEVKGRLKEQTLLDSNGEKIGAACRYRDQKLPAVLPGSKAHLARRYVLDSFGDRPVDDRMICCVICIYWMQEWLHR